MDSKHITSKELAEALQSWYATSSLGDGTGPMAHALFKDYGDMTWKDAAWSAASGQVIEYDSDA